MWKISGTKSVSTLAGILLAAEAAGPTLCNISQGWLESEETEVIIGNSPGY